MVSKTGRAVVFGVATGVSRAVYVALRSVAPGNRETWHRANASGRSVDRYPGPAVTLGAAAAAAVVDRGAALAVLGAGAAGALERRTLGPAVLATGALLAGCLMKERIPDRLLAAVVIAGAAHGTYLMDRRPGRAVLATAALAAPGLLRHGAKGALAAVPLGAAGAVTAEDLAERSTLGRTGAYALGAALGAAVVAGNGRAGLAAHALGLTAGTAYGEWTARRPTG